MTGDPPPAREPCPTCAGRGCRACWEGEVACPYCEGPETIEVPLDGEDEA